MTVQTSEVAFRAEGVSKSFGGVHAVDGVTLEARAGTITAIIGPNGAGKTSLFNVLTGFDRADTGSVSLFGERIDDQAAWKIARRGLVRSFQTPVGFPLLSVWENLMVAGSDASESPFRAILGPRAWRQLERETSRRADTLLDELGLTAVKDQRLEDLTAGQTKLVDFARLLMAQPRMMLLDEPAAGVAPNGIGRLAEQVNSLRERGITLLIIDHNIQFVFEVSDYVYVMAEGRVVVSGTPEEVAVHPTVAEIYLGTAR
ncbi:MULTISPECIES: ABC transporter ATP-binding protein [Mycobacteriaceae]|uniref:ABC transporter ATP-binding protein n=1 Tax=Mycobacteriaceae TaxID=1762 RepID=UPI0007FBE989|nr:MULTISPECIES: ABC transporter ATP-binding protein [Mycobacteriaceae]MCK0176296.1 ABC transporter ATP-binding protein [Mycolicibacterium sp. F2034L]OBB61681.1 ABC transporter ATP-binding protein [Mycobacterium sp. 852013-51886_SCH5428379]